MCCYFVVLDVGFVGMVDSVGCLVCCMGCEHMFVAGIALLVAAGDVVDVGIGIGGMGNCVGVGD